MPDAIANLERLLADSTEGPWEQDPADPCLIGVAGANPEGEWEVVLGDIWDADDARLVAAAPLLAQHCLALAKALALEVEVDDADEHFSHHMDGFFTTSDKCPLCLHRDALAAFERDFGGDDA